MPLKVYGSGDDLIILEGDINAEFYAEEETHYLAFSDGTLLIFELQDGNWAINVSTDADYNLTRATLDDDIASDVVYFPVLSVDWVVFGAHAQTNF
jgi:hypothetical protein